MAREQQLATEQAWKTAMEEEKLEKLAQVNKLVERVKGMEVKQHEIRQECPGTSSRKVPKEH